MSLGLNEVNGIYTGPEGNHMFHCFIKSEYKYEKARVILREFHWNTGWYKTMNHVKVFVIKIQTQKYVKESAGCIRAEPQNSTLFNKISET